jgi:hypothetical protein
MNTWFDVIFSSVGSPMDNGTRTFGSLAETTASCGVLVEPEQTILTLPLEETPTMRSGAASSSVCAIADSKNNAEAAVTVCLKK